MGWPIVTVASGGLPVVDVTASGIGMPVTEAGNGFGVAVTKVAAFGMPVVYVTAPRMSDGETDRDRAGPVSGRAPAAPTEAK